MEIMFYKPMDYIRFICKIKTANILKGAYFCAHVRQIYQGGVKNSS